MQSFRPYPRPASGSTAASRAPSALASSFCWASRTPILSTSCRNWLKNARACAFSKDENDKLNLSAKDLGYSALVVSQFTLYGDTKKGFRPSFIKAARPPLAVDAYELFLAEMNKQGLKDVQHGEFGADMQVSLVNEGPCTIVIDTDEWHKGEK